MNFECIRKNEIDIAVVSGDDAGALTSTEGTGNVKVNGHFIGEAEKEGIAPVLLTGNA